MNDTLNQVRLQVAEELRIDINALGTDATGTILKYALLAGVEEQKVMRCDLREGRCSRQDVRNDLAARLPALLATADGLVGIDSFRQRTDLQMRVLDLVLDALTSEPLAPEVLLALTPMTIATDVPLHGLIFSAWPHCTHELYPLLVDALVAGGCRAVGAPEDWVADGCLRRGIIFDDARGVLLETDFMEPLPLTTAQVLALNLREEVESHQRITERLSGVLLLNPLTGARVLDDKAQTGRIWQQAGLPTPAFATLSSSPDDARDVLAAFVSEYGSRVVLKPAGSTEGQGVELLDMANAAGRACIDAVLTRLCGIGGALVMEERGTVRYAGTLGPLRCTVRLNVCDGQVESGYAQVAGAPDGIASAGRGGRVVALRELWYHLCRSDGSSVTPDGDDWRRLLANAEAGAAALSRALGTAMPALCGLDLLLDITDDGTLAPVLLEANPRPAGMSHARYVSAQGPTDEPGVTQRLWQRMRSVS